jgi:hypothetical protein
MTSSIAERAAALALAGAVAALLGACAPAPRVQCDFTPLVMGQEVLPAGPRLVPMTPGTMMEVPLNTVSVIDPEIASRVMVQSVSASRNAAGNVAVAARLVNCTDWPVQVQGRTQFFDDALRSAEPASAWQRLHLPPRSFASYGEVSVSGAVAGSFLIEPRGGY